MRTLLITLGWLMLISSAQCASITVLIAPGQTYPDVYRQWAHENAHQLEVVPLVRVDALETTLQVPNTGDEDGAAAHIKSALTESVNQQFISAWQSALMIYQLNITQLPALVIDEVAVYYGLNPRLAFERYTASSAAVQ